MKTLILGLILLLSGVVAQAKQLTQTEVEKLCIKQRYERCDLILSIAFIESKFRTNAYNPEKTGSYGLMQIQCSTAKKVLGLKGDCNQLFDASTNIAFGIKYVKRLIGLLQQPTISQILSGYNAGLGYKCIKNKPCFYYAYPCKTKQDNICYPGEFVNQNYVISVKRYYNYLKRHKDPLWGIYETEAILTSRDSDGVKGPKAHTRSIQ